MKLNKNELSQFLNQDLSKISIDPKKAKLGSRKVVINNKSVSINDLTKSLYSIHQQQKGKASDA